MKKEIKKFGKLKLNKESLSNLKGGDLQPKLDAKQKTRGRARTRCCCNTYN